MIRDGKTILIENYEENIEIPDGIENVKILKGVGKIVLPNSIKEIDCYWYSAVSEVYFKGTIEEYFKINMSPWTILHHCS